jgi:hypothetical protein
MTRATSWTGTPTLYHNTGVHPSPPVSVDVHV